MISVSHLVVAQDGTVVGMSLSGAVSILLGLLTPVLVSFVNQPHWTGTTKRVMSIAVAVVVGLGNLVIQGAFGDFVFTWQSVVNALVLVVGASQAAYALLWKPTGAAEGIEGATSLRPVVIQAAPSPALATMNYGSGEARTGSVQSAETSSVDAPPAEANGY